VTNTPIRVLVIDDSALIRAMMTQMLNAMPDIKVVATARDPYIAREKIKQYNPDVLTLDIEMPRMDGLAFLRNLMRLRPMPVIMVSALTIKGAEATLRALELGAVDFVTKPQLDVAETFDSYSEELAGKIRTAAQARVHPLAVQPITDTATPSIALKVVPKYSADVILTSTQSNPHLKTTDKIIAIGASTGGTEALKKVLTALPAHTPGIVISQHIPAMFSSSFAARINHLAVMTVCEAEAGQVILPGHVYIAPGNQHLMVKRDGARYICHLSDGKPVNRHRPSVDVLFRSVAQSVGPNAIGVILTGMGSDGAQGLQEMHQVGAITVAQDELTSVVWGMPGEAVRLQAVDYILPLPDIAPQLLQLSEQLMLS